LPGNKLVNCDRFVFRAAATSMKLPDCEAVMSGTEVLRLVRIA
jgi:hypothetical protein